MREDPMKLEKMDISSFVKPTSATITMKQKLKEI